VSNFGVMIVDITDKHLAVRNPALDNRIGCWNTVILTACKVLTQPGEARNLTARLDMVTCSKCLAWAKRNPDKLRGDGAGHKVTV
jgi:hypothetical protein